MLTVKELVAKHGEKAREISIIDPNTACICLYCGGYYDFFPKPFVPFAEYIEKIGKLTVKDFARFSNRHMYIIVDKKEMYENDASGEA